MQLSCWQWERVEKNGSGNFWRKIKKKKGENPPYFNLHCMSSKFFRRKSVITWSNLQTVLSFGSEAIRLTLVLISFISTSVAHVLCVAQDHLARNIFQYYMFLYFVLTFCTHSNSSFTCTCFGLVVQVGSRSLLRGSSVCCLLIGINNIVQLISCQEEKKKFLIPIVL